MKKFVGILLVAVMLTASVSAFADLKQPWLGGEDLNKYTTAPKALGFPTKDHPVPSLIQPKGVEVKYVLVGWEYIRAVLLGDYANSAVAQEVFDSYEEFYNEVVSWLTFVYYHEDFNASHPVPASWIGYYPHELMTLEEFIELFVSVHYYHI